MKKNYLLLISLFLVAMSASAQVTVCGAYLEESGQVNSPYITSGTVTWDATSHTLTLDNASIEYTSNNPQDGIRPIRVTNDATIVVHGDCKLTTTGHVAIALDSYNSKNVTIKGNGTLSTSSSWIDIFLVVAHLTIQDITLNVDMGIANNAEGNGVGLAFNNVQATIKDGVARIGDGITFTNCAITYPEGAYVEQADYGYTIYYGNHQSPDKIIISRTGSNVKGDVNGDGEVNIADVNAVIKVILGGDTNPRADVNNDTEVNIADVNAVINIILNPEPADNHEWVDLGLPSGTLWATMNVGATIPEDYGDFFAWGETEPKSYYFDNNYKWYGGSWYNHLTSILKYCTQSDHGYNGFVDNKTELDPEDDAAFVNWGPAWRTPTFEQIEELSDHCTTQWTQRNGTNGLLLTGPNGNTMFLPASGMYMEDELLDADSVGFYWSRSLNPNAPNFAYCLVTDSEDWGWWHFGRDSGFTVRPVRVQ